MLSGRKRRGGEGATRRRNKGGMVGKRQSNRHNVWRVAFESGKLNRPGGSVARCAA